MLYLNHLTSPTEVITTSPDTPTVATDDSSGGDTPFYREAAFISGMVILGVCLVFIAGAVFLCFIRPRGDPGFLASPLSLSSHLDIWVYMRKHSPQPPHCDKQERLHCSVHHRRTCQMREMRTHSWSLHASTGRTLHGAKRRQGYSRKKYYQTL